MKLIFHFAVYFTSVIALLGNAAKGAMIYDVTLDTSLLIGHPAGPFALNFQFIDGSQAGDSNNSVMVTDVSLGGGGAIDSTILIGGVSGAIGGPIGFADTSFLNSFTQSFTPGSSLRFRFLITENVENGPQPDEFSVAILDSTGVELPTNGPANALLILDVDGTQPRVFAGDGSITPADGGSGIPLPAPVVRLIQPADAPEPNSQTLVAVILIFLVVYQLRLRSMWQRRSKRTKR